MANTARPNVVSRCEVGADEKRRGMPTPLRLAARLLLMLAVALPAGAALSERKVHVRDGLEIEANVGDEAYVEALVKALAGRPAATVLPADAVRLPLRLEDLTAKRERILARICGYLALEKPSPQMVRAYDGVPTLWRELQQLSIPARPEKYALWRRDDLIARLEAGEKVAGFTRDASGGLTVEFQYGYEVNLQTTDAERRARRAAAWSGMIWPVKIGTEPGDSPESVAATAMEDLQSFSLMTLGMEAGQMQRLQVFNVLHETVESGIVWSYIASPDRRWFCDGMANYLAWKILVDEVGAEAAQSYYDLAAELQKHAAEAGQSDLAAWPAAEHLGDAGYREQLNAANYAFATKVIADFCAKHGDGWVAPVFKEIGRTPAKKTSMDTVYRAVRKVTKDDLRNYLPKPPKTR